MGKQFFEATTDESGKVSLTEVDAEEEDDEDTEENEDED